MNLLFKSLDYYAELEFNFHHTCVVILALLL